MATEYQMPRRSERCCACDRRFEVGDAIQACLFETPGGYERRDYCVACPRPDDVPLAMWRTRRPEPAVPRATPFDREAILAFFRRLAGADTPAKLQLRFVLALLLWRKKVLVLDSSRTSDDGTETWHFTMPKTDNAYDIQRPDLDEARIEQLSAQLEALLAGEQVETNLTATAVIEESVDG